MIIAIDCDETLLNLVDKWCAYYNHDHGTNFTREDMKNYGSLDREWTKYLRIPGFHADLPWMEPNAFDILKQLKQEGNRIIIVTSPPTWEMPKDRYRWLHTNLKIPGVIQMRDIVFTRDKSLIEADILVDDSPEHLESFRGFSICYDQPWNQEWEGPRAYNWNEVRKLIMDREFLDQMET